MTAETHDSAPKDAFSFSAQFTTKVTKPACSTGKAKPMNKEWSLPALLGLMELTQIYKSSSSVSFAICPRPTCQTHYMPWEGNRNV